LTTWFCFFNLFNQAVKTSCDAKQWEACGKDAGELAWKIKDVVGSFTAAGKNATDTAQASDTSGNKADNHSSSIGIVIGVGLCTIGVAAVALVAHTRSKRANEDMKSRVLLEDTDYSSL
jgi:hypothetical protein